MPGSANGLISIYIPIRESSRAAAVRSEVRAAYGVGRIGTRHPGWVAAELPCGNSAGTLAESIIYSQPMRKIRRLHVYVRKRVENRRLRGKWAVCGYRRGNPGLLRRQRVETKGSGQKWRPGALPRA